MNIYCALVHYPAYNKNRSIITTSITTSSIHDISRTAKTYNLKAFFIITPVLRQQALIETIIRHWKSGYGAQYNPTRKMALDVIKICSSLDRCIKEIYKIEEQMPQIVVTCARGDGEITSFQNLKEIIYNSDFSWLILFGTGWGLTQDVIEMADMQLEPIKGTGDYNHLSVRAAVAITLDRLLGLRGTV